MRTVQLLRENREAEIKAIACQALSFIENEQRMKAFENFFSANASGVTLPAFKKWWRDHKKADHKRRMAERQAEREERLRKSGLSKLTDAEARVLGLKKGNVDVG